MSRAIARGAASSAAPRARLNQPRPAASRSCEGRACARTCALTCSTGARCCGLPARGTRDHQVQATGRFRECRDAWDAENACNAECSKACVAEHARDPLGHQDERSSTLLDTRRMLAASSCFVAGRPSGVTTSVPSSLHWTRTASPTLSPDSSSSSFVQGNSRGFANPHHGSDHAPQSGIACCRSNGLSTCVGALVVGERRPASSREADGDARRRVLNWRVRRPRDVGTGSHAAERSAGMLVVCLRVQAMQSCSSQSARARSWFGCPPRRARGRGVHGVIESRCRRGRCGGRETVSGSWSSGAVPCQPGSVARDVCRARFREPVRGR